MAADLMNCHFGVDGEDSAFQAVLKVLILLSQWQGCDK